MKWDVGSQLSVQITINDENNIGCRLSIQQTINDKT